MKTYFIPDPDHNSKESIDKIRTDLAQIAIESQEDVPLQNAALFMEFFNEHVPDVLDDEKGETRQRLEGEFMANSGRSQELAKAYVEIVHTAQSAGFTVIGLHRPEYDSFKNFRWLQEREWGAQFGLAFRTLGGFDSVALAIIKKYQQELNLSIAVIILGMFHWQNLNKSKYLKNDGNTLSLYGKKASQDEDDFFKTIAPNYEKAKSQDVKAREILTKKYPPREVIKPKGDAIIAAMQQGTQETWPIS